MQVTDSVGMLETYAEVDKSLADLNGIPPNSACLKTRAFIEAMNQQMAQTLFYGDSSVNPQQFMGLSSRYSSLSAGNAQNIIDAGGTGTDNTSIWLVVWGENTVHGIFPKGQKAGIQMEDKGGDTGRCEWRQVRRLPYPLQMGQRTCSLRDWRYVVRIANIDVSNLSEPSSAANIAKLMVKALHRIPKPWHGPPGVLHEPHCRRALDLQSLENISGYQRKETEGEWWTSFVVYQSVKLMRFWKQKPAWFNACY